MDDFLVNCFIKVKCVLLLIYAVCEAITAVLLCFADCQVVSVPCVL